MTTSTIATSTVTQLDSPSRNTEAELKRLLEARLSCPENAIAIDNQIHQTFVQRYAVMNLDLSGFSRLTRHNGIIGTLAEIQRMRNLVTPIVQRHGGTVIKYEADNVYSIYTEVRAAVNGAIAILQSLATAGMRGSIGIGYGDLIMLAEAGRYTNAYGDQMNLAAKLGEDLAEVNEILLTEEAFQQIDSHAGHWSSRRVTISKIEFPVYCCCH
jgi:adenylate cyclase